MDPIVIIEREQLNDLLKVLRFDHPIRTLHVAIDDGGVKIKINNGLWSPAIGMIES